MGSQRVRSDLATEQQQRENARKVKDAQACPTLCDHTECSPLGSSVHANSPGKNPGVGSMLSSRGSSQTKGCMQIRYRYLLSVLTIQLYSKSCAWITLNLWPWIAVCGLLSQKEELVRAGVWGMVQNPQPVLSLWYSEIDLSLDDIVTQILKKRIFF